MKIEKEVRYYFPQSYKNGVLERLKKSHEYGYSCHEITEMYDNPNPEFTFYSPEIDGRLRLRTILPCEQLFGKDKSNKVQHLLTWKRRIPKSANDGMRREEEIEVDFLPDDISVNPLKELLENVLKCPRISSYERLRHNFSNSNILVTLDEFPFGLMLEFELKKGDEKSLQNCVEAFGLKLKDSSNLSCDDMYKELCIGANTPIKSEILFGDEAMPKVS